MGNCPHCLQLNQDCNCKKVKSDDFIYTGPNLPCSDVDNGDNLTLVVQKLDAKVCNVLDQNNFVRDLLINIFDLPDPYTLDDICNYILSLPASERTIAETDSKWNVIIFQASS